jgi:hypothetical protein
MISPFLRQQLHDNLDEQPRLLELAAQEAAGNIGALKPIDAARRLGYKSADTINRLVDEGKLRKVEGLITIDSITEFLGTTPRARRRQDRTNKTRQIG